MEILKTILETKRLEISDRRERVPVKFLEQSVHFAAPTVSLRRYLTRPDKVGIIAEIKRRSPSKGVLNPNISVEQLSIGYMQAGASALSVLTDEKYFGGRNDDLTIARRYNFCPILRKDFVIDEYQVLEAKSIGADAVLLIAAALAPEQIRSLSSTAHSLGLEVLLEVHTAEELQRSFMEGIDVVGVNNRDLRDFSVDVGRSLAIGGSIPAGVPRVSESGISDASTIHRLRAAGYNGFLIGEAFMRTSKPEEACARLVRQVREMEREHAER